MERVAELVRLPPPRAPVQHAEMPHPHFQGPAGLDGLDGKDGKPGLRVRRGPRRAPPSFSFLPQEPKPREPW